MDGWRHQAQRSLQLVKKDRRGNHCVQRQEEGPDSGYKVICVAAAMRCKHEPRGKEGLRTQIETSPSVACSSMAVQGVGHCILNWKADPPSGSGVADRPFKSFTSCKRMSALKLKPTNAVQASSHCLGVVMYCSLLGTQSNAFLSYVRIQ